LGISIAASGWTEAALIVLAAASFFVEAVVQPEKRVADPAAPAAEAIFRK
jgi:hypothetical protein